MGRNERAEDEKPGADGGVHHNGDLYDEDKADESTGGKFDNDEHPADEELAETTDPNPPDEQEGDEADQWLKKHG